MFYQSLDFKNICITTVVAALHVVILVLSKDLGSALIFFISYVIMLFIATGNWLYLIAAGVLGKGATSIAYTLFDHVRRRFTAWKIHGQILIIQDIRSPSPCLLLEQVAGLAWDCARECQTGSR